MVHEIASTPRARRRDANLERILSAAMTLVADGGLDALSMIRLADAVDYTPGALYRYVDSKDALLSRLVGRVLGQARAALDLAVAQVPDWASPLVRVFALVDGYRTFARREPHGFGLVASTMAAPQVLLTAPSDAEPVARMVMAALQPLAEALGAAATAELLAPGDVAERTLCLFGLLQGVLLLHKQARFAPAILDVDRLTTHGTRSLLLGWGGQARAVDAAIARAARTADGGGAA